MATLRNLAVNLLYLNGVKEITWTLQAIAREGKSLLDTRPKKDRRLERLRRSPVYYAVVEFPAGESNFTGEMAAELRVLVNAGTIRVIDVLILTKDADGTVEANELSDIRAVIASVEAAANTTAGG